MKKLLSLVLAFLLLLTLFAGCGKDPSPSGTDEALTVELAVPVPEGAAAPADNARVFYEIFVGSFSDSDGDGIGDLRGIIQRMDYLNDGDENSGKSLGVEGIWLTPIFPSSSYHKYDIDDYCAVDKSFGTLEDLKELVELCHSRNVQVILDLPINHTSKAHAWFKSFTEARKNGAEDDPYYDFYSCYTQGQEAPGGRAFSKLAGTDVYYECNFWDGMPELNFDNPAVRQAVLDTAKFWLDLGVDGFRFDAAKYVYYGDHTASTEFWGWYLDQLRALKPDVYTVAEVWDDDWVTDLYYPAMNCFDFTVSQAEGLIAGAAKDGSVNSYLEYVQSYLNNVKSLREDAMIVPFIANHDTDRAAGYLPSGGGFAQMAANILLLSPGSPFLYYGEEIGMRGSRGGASTDANRRLAMLWGDGDTIEDPEGTTYPAENRADGTVREQVASESSLYTHYKKVILLRKANPEIARGSFTPIKLSGSAGGFVSEWNGSRAAVFHNAADAEAVIDLAALELAGFTVVSGYVGMGEARLEGATLTLGGQTSVVLRAG